MNRIQATMDDLPELPFEKVLSYLNLEDRLKARAVSRRWYHTINRFKVKTLCYSERPAGFILGKNRWVSGAFAQNFISSTRFESFFSEYARSVLANLKHLHLCDLNLDLENRTAFTRTLKSFGQLEELGIIRARCSQKRTFTLNLPMLTSIHLEDLSGIQKLTLNAPRLRKVKFVTYRYASSVLLDIVHGESVESLYVWNIARIIQKAVKNLKNLKYLYVLSFPWAVDPTFLSSLEQLKELHMYNINAVEPFFRQKQQCGRANLKIYLAGWLLSGPDDPMIPISSYFFIFDPNNVCHLTENPSRLADVIPFHEWIVYDKAYYFPESVINIMSRLPDLKSVYVKVPIRDIQNFLDLLKNCDIVELKFDDDDDQPQDLFDRLPEHCAIQKLIIRRPPPVGFLFRLKHLIHLDIGWSIDAETIRKVFEELPFVSSFRFKYLDSYASIESAHPESFTASVLTERIHGKRTFCNLNAAIEFLQEFISLSWIGQRPTA